MKHALLLIIWMILTIILIVSVIGLVAICPQPNHTDYHKPQEQQRSTWMRIGYGLYERVLE